MSAEQADAESLRAAIRQELACLWNDLHDARRSARNGSWSIRCDHLVWRIESLTKLVGPTPWDEIQLPLLEDGIYQRVHADMSVAVEVDMAKVAEVRASIDARSARLVP